MRSARSGATKPEFRDSSVNVLFRTLIHPKKRMRKYNIFRSKFFLDQTRDWRVTDRASFVDETCRTSRA
jgi:hypothetical protein